MVENFMVDERVFVLKGFKAQITVLTDSRLVLVSIVSREAGSGTVSLVAQLAVIVQTWPRKKN